MDALSTAFNSLAAISADTTTALAALRANGQCPTISDGLSLADYNTALDAQNTWRTSQSTLTDTYLEAIDTQKEYEQNVIDAGLPDGTPILVSKLTYWAKSSYWVSTPKTKHIIQNTLVSVSVSFFLLDVIQVPE